SAIKARSRDALVARGLASARDGVERPTVAGLLLFGREPQRVFPQATVRLLQYEGTSRETGARSNIVQDRRIEGSLASQIETVRRTLRRWIPSAIRLQPEGRFQPATILPEFAWVE